MKDVDALLLGRRTYVTHAEPFEPMAKGDPFGDVMNAPKGPERIARCEAFLKEHPGYPEPRPIIRVLVDDTLESGSYDPAHVARLVERLAQPEGGSPNPSTAWMLEHYCLKYGLPPETARRLLGWSREVLQQQQRSL